MEYIESTWSQYLDSLYKPNYNTKIYVKFAHNEHVIDTPVFGARTSNSQNAYILWSHPSEYGASTGWSQAIFNSVAKTWITDLSQWTIIEFEYSKTGWYYNNSTWTWSPWSGTPNVNLIIFWLRQWTSIDNRKFSWKMRSFKIWENNVLVRDFIPVYRKSDSVVGMYDSVNDVFYTNKWSGSFTKWPDL